MESRVLMALAFWKRLAERRSDERIAAKAPITLRVVDAKTGQALTSEQRGVLINLSSGGCCLALANLFVDGVHLHRCLAEPDTLEVLVSLPANGSREHLQSGRVRWINREFSDESFCFRVGVQFVQRGLPAGWRNWIRPDNLD